MLRWECALIAVILGVTPAFGQAPEAASGEAVAAATIRIPAGTVVHVELAEPLSSRTSQIGDTFALRLIEPIVIGGRLVAPAGASGGGEVIDADSSGFGGRQGKLILSGRYLDIAGQRVRIRSMQITGVGRDRALGALALSTIPFAGMGAIFVRGGEIEMPEGAYGAARIASDIDIPITALPAPAEPAPDAAPHNPNGEEEE